MKSAIVRGLRRGELVSVRKIQPLGDPSDTWQIQAAECIFMVFRAETLVGIWFLSLRILRAD